MRVLGFIEEKGPWVKIVANPFLQFLPLGVVRSADGFQQVVVTWHATAVLAWTMAFSPMQTGYASPGSGVRAQPVTEIFSQQNRSSKCKAGSPLVT
jgi:hypothetical protein